MIATVHRHGVPSMLSIVDFMIFRKACSRDQIKYQHVGAYMHGVLAVPSKPIFSSRKSTCI